ncbi:MAG TPA: 30S ribosomal protein S7 [Candidatus Binatia bacterium]|jgi:small subunit ribosomal protein S7
MPRKGEVRKREGLPDPKYGDKLVAKFVNTIMSRGKKSVAETIFYRSLDIVTSRTKEDSLGVFKRAIENTRPTVEVRSRRVGGATYQVPVEVRPQRRLSLSMRWLIQAARDRSEKSMEEKLAAEIVDAANNRGTAIKKKEDTHRMAEANRAFAHYRW